MTWPEIVLRAVTVLAAFLVLPLLIGQTEHKLMAHMQGRLGPMYAGGFHGWAQLVADGVKFAQKEDILPYAADRRVFRLAPVPIHPGVAAIDVPASLLLFLAATSVGALGTLMAGWSSGNKYSLLGGLRAAAQLISYELPIVLATASIALALRFALFLLAEYAGIVVMSLVFAAMWLGGWHGPLPDTLGWLWTLLKGFAVAVVIIWVRVAWPRLREDQLQRLAWLWLVPLGLAQLFLTGIGVVMGW